jgi:hypothetical protein
VLRRGEEVLLRASAIAGSRLPTQRSGSRGDTGWTTAFSATWETPAATLPTLALGDYQELDAQGEWTGRCADDRLLRPSTGRSVLRGADPAVAELLHALDALQ